MQRRMHTQLLLTGMGCFLFACTASLINVLFFPFARELYGYPATIFFAAFALALCVFYVLGKALRRRDEATLERVVKIAVPAFLLILFVLHLLLGYMMAYTPAGDNRALIEGAGLLAADGNFDANPNYYLYMSRYSNQWGFLLILTALFKLFCMIGLTDFLFPLVVLQALLYIAGMWATLSIARMLRGSRGVLVMIAVLTFCLPLYLAAAVLYTDTFSLPFIMLTLYFALKTTAIESSSRQINALVTALFALLGSQVKMTVLIALIAAWIVWMLVLRMREAIICCTISAVIVIGGILGIQGFMTSRVLDPEMIAQHHTPAIHWVMMSIPTSDNPYGGFSYDYAITWGMMDEGASHEEVMTSIYSRMKDRIYTLRYPNRLILATLRKNSAIIGDGTFGMTETLDDDPKRFNTVSSFVLSFGRHYRLYSAVCTGIFMAHMVFAALGCLHDIRARDTHLAMLYVSMFGILLFLMFWEARSRYMFGFVPVLLLLSCAQIARDKEEKNEVQEKSSPAGHVADDPLLSVHGGQPAPCAVDAVRS